jgi:ABC-type amino acid transport substrate-binding protein
VPVTPADRIPKLVNGAIDLECGSTTITFGRMEQVAFSHMISVDGGSLLATTDSGIGAVKDLAGKRVGVIPNTTTEKALAAALVGASVQATVIPVTEIADGLRGVSRTRRLRLGSPSSRACCPPPESGEAWLSDEYFP